MQRLKKGRKVHSTPLDGTGQNGTVHSTPLDGTGQNRTVHSTPLDGTGQNGTVQNCLQTQYDFKCTSDYRDENQNSIRLKLLHAYMEENITCTYV